MEFGNILSVNCFIYSYVPVLGQKRSQTARSTPPLPEIPDCISMPSPHEATLCQELPPNIENKAENKLCCLPEFLPKVNYRTKLKTQQHFFKDYTLAHKPRKRTKSKTRYNSDIYWLTLVITALWFEPRCSLGLKHGLIQSFFVLCNQQAFHNAIQITLSVLTAPPQSESLSSPLHCEENWGKGGWHDLPKARGGIRFTVRIRI